VDISITSQTTQTVTYAYNLQNRLKKVTTIPYSGGVPGTSTVIAYKYNPQGVRVAEIKDPDGAALVTDYLIDPYNHTGFAQVIEEASPTETMFYPIGDDVLARCKSLVPGRKFLLYDGHGSVRQLTGWLGLVNGSYCYDGYGVSRQDNTDFPSNGMRKVPFWPVD
jgi:hypothetical protein